MSPAERGVQVAAKILDSGFRRTDVTGCEPTCSATGSRQAGKIQLSRFDPQLSRDILVTFGIE
jgi:hypothetical protein